MSTGSKNNWRLLHELVLRAKEAKDFETLGAVMDQMDELIHKTRERLSTGEHPPFYNELCAAYDAAQEKMQFWRANPPPITPQETQIGPGNPFPIPPPPPPPTVATPKPQAPGSLDALRKTIVCAITNEKEAVNGQYGGADVGLLLNALVRMVDKAFADHAAQNQKAIESAAEPVRTPEPWTGETLYLAAEAKTKATFAVENWPELTNDNQVLWMLAASAANERMGNARSPLKPWTGDELYEAFRQAVWGAGKKEDWQRFSDSVRDDFLILTMLVNQRMGIAAK